MFTIGDICDIAIQIEQNGEATYRKAAENVENDAMQSALNRMADEELRHAQWFKNFNRDGSAGNLEEELEEMGRALLRDMVKDQTFSLDANQLSQSTNLNAFLNQSITFEQDTIMFYEMLRGFIEDADVLSQLNRIIAQEQDHIQQIKRLMPSHCQTESE